MQQLELERERAQVDRSILDMSADLAAAQRDQVVHRPSLSLENIWKQARDEWLALRAERLEGAIDRGGEGDRHAGDARRGISICQRGGTAIGRELVGIPACPAAQSRPQTGGVPDLEQGRDKKRDRGRDDDFGL